MAKELYARFNTLEVKVQDDDTSFDLKAIDSGNSIPLDNKSLVIKIKNDTGYLKDISATLKNRYTVTFSSAGLKDLDCGTYSFELWATDNQTNKTMIYPSSGFQTLTITENVYTKSDNVTDNSVANNSSNFVISTIAPKTPYKGQIWIKINELNTIESLNQWNGTAWVSYLF